ncbi:MAG: tectonin domain-containing protein [Actinomycetota bacterium]
MRKRTTHGIVRLLAMGLAAVGLGLVAVMLSGGAASAATPTIIVDSVGDDADAAPADGSCATAGGECTLRAAIETANARAGSDVIHFDIPGAGTHTITTASDLPTIYDTTGYLEIDGYSQGDARPNTATHGSNAVLRVQIQGTTSYGLRITSAENTVKGLAISGFDYNIAIHYEQADGNTIVGNFIGPDASGEYVAGSRYGVWIWLGPDRNVIGTPALADRNVISGNPAKGLQIEQGTTSRNFIQNNVIGLNPSLTDTLPQSYGFDVQWGTWGNVIGGPNPGDGNLIGGMRIGIDMSHSSAGALIQGNHIGTMGGGDSISDFSQVDLGILLKDNSQGHFITGNVISARNYGIWSRHNYNGPTTIVANRLGVGAGGAALSSTGIGIQVNGHDDLVQDNIIANHDGGGIIVIDRTYTDRHTNFPPEQTLSNRLVQNTFYNNAASGFQVVPGGLNHISAGIDGSQWGVNSLGNVYRRQPGGTWALVSGGMVQVDAYDYDTAVGVNASDQIFRYENGAWTRIPGGLSHVSIGVDGSMWGTNSANQTYRRPPGGTAWELTQAGLAQVDAYDYGTAVGVTSGGNIWRYQDGAWAQIAGGLSQVSYGTDQSIWGRNSNSSVYRRTNTATSWQAMAGSMTVVAAVTIDEAYAVDAADKIYHFAKHGQGLNVDIEPLGAQNEDDPGDADDGPHRLLNRPVFTGAGAGEVYGTACAGCQVQVYLNGSVASDGTVDLGSTSGQQGAAWAGTVQANGSGQWSLGDARMTVGRTVYALAIDGEGNTSEWTVEGLQIPATPFGIGGNPSASLAREAAPAPPDLPDRHVRVFSDPFTCVASNGTLAWTDAGANEYYLFATLNGTETYLGAQAGPAVPVAGADSYRVTHWRFGKAVSTTCDGPGPDVAPTFDCSYGNGTLSWDDAGASTYYVFAEFDATDDVYLGAQTTTSMSAIAADGYRVTHWLGGRTVATCDGPGPAAPDTFDCSFNNGTLSWDDAGASAYYVFATSGGVDTYLGGFSTTSISADAADSYRVTHWLGGRTVATCDGPGPAAPFSCSVNGTTLTWDNAGASTYYVHATSNGVDTYLGGHTGTSLTVAAADSYRVTYWTGGQPTRALC